jgi:hypothetical protein
MLGRDGSIPVQSRAFGPTCFDATEASGANTERSLPKRSALCAGLIALLIAPPVLADLAGRSPQVAGVVAQPKRAGADESLELDGFRVALGAGYASASGNAAGIVSLSPTLKSGAFGFGIRTGIVRSDVSDPGVFLGTYAAFLFVDFFDGPVDLDIELGLGDGGGGSAAGCHVYGPWVHFGLGVTLPLGKGAFAGPRVWNVGSIGSSCDGDASSGETVSSVFAATLDVGYRVVGW